MKPPLWFPYAAGFGAPWKIIVVGGLDEGRLLVCKLDLASERLLEHVKVLDVGSLSRTTALERNLGLLQQATALVPLRSWVWGTIRIIVSGGLDESHLLVCKIDLVSERLLEHVKVLDVVSLSCTNGQLTMTVKQFGAGQFLGA